MYVSENHPNRAALLARQAAAEPSGRVLCRLPRRAFAGKPPGELVVTLEDLDGREFISIRAGKLFATIRLGEAEEVAAAILEGLRLAENLPARGASTPPARRPPSRRPGPAPRRGPSRAGQGGLPLAEPDSVPWDNSFSEFAD